MSYGNPTMKRTIRLMLLGSSACLASLGATPVLPAQPQLSALQGAWLQQSSSCSEVYTSSGKGMSFKKSVNEFVPAFIVSGGRLKTPVNSCRIAKIVPAASRWMMKLDCTGSVSTMVANVQFSLTADGALLRYLNDQDTSGSRYERCSARAARAPS
jgi:hypothetical protein